MLETMKITKNFDGQQFPNSRNYLKNFQQSITILVNCLHLACAQFTNFDPAS